MAGGLLLERYGGPARDVESKSSATDLVSEADRASEAAIRDLLAQERPDDGLLGEEGSRKESHNGRRWIIDPVDGTRDFVRGNSAWAVLIGFEAEGDVQAGLAFLPAMDHLFQACRGQGAFRNDAPVHVSPIADIRQAVLCVNGLNSIRKCSFAPRLLDWMRPFWGVRSMGGCLDAMMVASGQADLWIEPAAQPWDLAPLKVIAEEAGGRFFNFDGGSSIYGGNCVVCTPGLEAEAKRLLQP